MLNFRDEITSHFRGRSPLKWEMPEVSPALFLKIKKSALILEKKHSDCVYLWVKFLMWNVVLRDLVENLRKFSQWGFSFVLKIKYLSKCPYSKKSSLPWKIPGCTLHLHSEHSLAFYLIDNSLQALPIF